MLTVILLFSCCLVVSTWIVFTSVYCEEGTDECMHVHIVHWSWAGHLSLVPLSDMQPEWTWHSHLTGAKWAMSNDRGHPAYWLIVLNNEPGSPLWLVLEMGGWQLADPSTVCRTLSLKWICRMTAGVAGDEPPFSIHPLQHILYVRDKPSYSAAWLLCSTRISLKDSFCFRFGFSGLTFWGVAILQSWDNLIQSFSGLLTAIVYSHRHIRNCMYLYLNHLFIFRPNFLEKQPFVQHL